MSNDNSKRMTPERLQEIRELRSSIKHEPWECKDSPEAPFDGQFRVLGEFFDSHVDGQSFDDRYWLGWFGEYQNAKFAAAAPKIIDELLAEIDALRSRIYELAESRAEMVAQHNEALKERDALRVHKWLLFEENGRLFAEKESGLWDSEHPIRKERDQLREKIAVAKSCLEKMNRHICDGGGEFPCSQMWYQDLLEEALSKIKGDKNVNET